MESDPGNVIQFVATVCDIDSESMLDTVIQGWPPQIVLGPRSDQMPNQNRSRSRGSPRFHGETDCVGRGRGRVEALGRVAKLVCREGEREAAAARAWVREILTDLGRPCVGWSPESCGRIG
jgi:hypothetical protein